MAFVHNCPVAEANPRIREFVAAVEDVAGDKVFTQDQFQQKRFIEFWSHSNITRYIKERDDYLFMLVGGELVQMGGRDMTGKYLSEGNYLGTENDLRTYNADVIREKRAICCSASIDIVDHDYKAWLQVKIPFEMNGQQNHTLGLTVFESAKSQD